MFGLRGWGGCRDLMVGGKAVKFERGEPLDL